MMILLWFAIIFVLEVFYTHYIYVVKRRQWCAPAHSFPALRSVMQCW